MTEQISIKQERPQTRNRGHILSKDATKVDGTLMMQNLAKGKLTVDLCVEVCVCVCVRLLNVRRLLFQVVVQAGTGGRRGGGGEIHRKGLGGILIHSSTLHL